MDTPLDFQILDIQDLIDPIRLTMFLRPLLETPSVVGYYPQIHAHLEKIVKPLGYEVTYDNRHTAYIYVPGQDKSKTVCVGAHLDTIGMIVRSIEEDGTLNIRNLGGVNFHSLEGENVFIHTREAGTYTGTVICKSHSVHVFDDAREKERDFSNMAILIDEEVENKEDVLKLGILPGDLISVDPRFVLTDSGYVKSRHIDDKACVACLLEALSILSEQNLKPAYNTYFAFPIYEEIGLGGSYVPEGVSEYLALDIGLVGGMQSGSEKRVSISGGDRIAPYDWGLTTELMHLARKYQIDYVMDVYYRYGSDGTSAFQAGQNIAPASIGMGCMSSHGYERTHMAGIFNTTALTLAYLLDRKEKAENEENEKGKVK